MAEGADSTSTPGNKQGAAGDGVSTSEARGSAARTFNLAELAPGNILVAATRVT